MRVSTPIQDIELSEICKSEACSESLPENIVASMKGLFSWSDDAKPVIDIECWNIRRRAFTLVLGPVGCGKSTLLKALLGELSSFRGTISTNFSGATYCGQSAWIPNATVRDIVIGHGAFEDAWYKRVIAACALEQDIASWPNGDKTVAGTKGISMSGGQKHRLVRSFLSSRYPSKSTLLNHYRPLPELCMPAKSCFYLTTHLAVLTLAQKKSCSATYLVAKACYAIMTRPWSWFHQTVSCRFSSLRQVVADTKCEARRLSFADDVIFLNEDGQIKAAELASTSSQLSNVVQPRVAMNTAKGSASNTSGLGNEKPPEAVINALEEQADATRQLGDWAMYSFYAKAAGWLSLSMFAGFMVVFAFFDSFPGKTRPLPLRRPLVTNPELCRHLAQMVDRGKRAETQPRSRQVGGRLRRSRRGIDCLVLYQHMVRIPLCRNFCSC